MTTDVYVQIPPFASLEGRRYARDDKRDYRLGAAVSAMVIGMVSSGAILTLRRCSA
jgi:hypothetical protein